MKRTIYGTLALFIGVLIMAWVIAARHPVRQVTYRDGRVVEADK